MGRLGDYEFGFCSVITEQDYASGSSRYYWLTFCCARTRGEIMPADYLVRASTPALAAALGQTKPDPL